MSGAQRSTPPSSGDGSCITSLLDAQSLLNSYSGRQAKPSGQALLESGRPTDKAQRCVTFVAAVEPEVVALNVNTYL